jgi:hypothetical protein
LAKKKKKKKNAKKKKKEKKKKTYSVSQSSSAPAWRLGRCGSVPVKLECADDGGVSRFPANERAAHSLRHGDLRIREFRQWHEPRGVRRRDTAHGRNEPHGVDPLGIIHGRIAKHIVQHCERSPPESRLVHAALAVCVCVCVFFFFFFFFFFL